MNQLVITNEQGNDVTTSLIVAETFGKRHSDVLRDIENLHCSKEFKMRNFAFSFIIRQLPNGGSKKEPFAEIAKDGFAFLAMGFTGKKAAAFKEAFINAFNKMEEFIKNTAESKKNTAYLLEHSSVEVQKKNSKEINAKIYINMGVESVIEYNQKSCLLHTGKRPSELKRLAKEAGLPSKQRTSGKEVLRNTRPEIACSMSLTDELVKHGKDLESAARLSIVHAQPIFKEMIALGITPPELAA